MLRTLVLAGLAFATVREHATRMRGAGATYLSCRGSLEARRGARGRVVLLRGRVRTPFQKGACFRKRAHPTQKSALARRAGNSRAA